MRSSNRLLEENEALIIVLDLNLFRDMAVMSNFCVVHISEQKVVFFVLAGWGFY